MQEPNINGAKQDVSTPDTQYIIEERILKPNGEVMTRKYAKGRFLGKVEHEEL